MKKTAATLQDVSKQKLQPSFEAADETEEILERAVLRLNANILGIVLGILAGLTIFIATNFLILKGGEVVGPHLGLLRAFFPYYSVTFLGSIVGFGWGLVSGYLAGVIIASVYNLVVKFKSK
jgi:tetrahydromethanopterin S-methyltransferase subunit G